MTSSHDVTRLLQQWADGDRDALDRLVPLVYAELRRVATRQLRNERAGHSLAPTALVHELYLRLIDQRAASWQHRAHFFGVAARLMRRILVDHARARLAGKRGGAVTLVPLHTVPDVPDGGGRVADVLAIDEALDRLTARDAEQGRLVELRFFAGLTVEEAAHVLGRSPRTIKREWRLARAWLYRELQIEPEG
jgi:RNA polymerase sigma factor (TIGR02999 family)